MSHNQNKNDVVLAETIFTPVMDVKSATQGFKDFQKLKLELLSESDIVEIQGKPHVKKSGWNKLAVFFGVSTRTTKSEKLENPDGSYEWRVTTEAYKKNKEGVIIYSVERSALVSSLEKEKTEGMKNSPRKSHDVFASAETRAEGRTLAAFFGSGEVSAEEMEGVEHHTTPKIEFCPCPMKDTKPSEEKSILGLYECRFCAKPISEVRMEQIRKMIKPTS